MVSEATIPMRISIMSSSHGSSSIQIIKLANMSSNTKDTLISINGSSLPIKLTPTNYSSWRAQFNALLLGYDLVGYIDGTLSCPLPTLMKKEEPNPTYHLWQHQDKLLLHGIMASVSNQ